MDLDTNLKTLWYTFALAKKKYTTIPPQISSDQKWNCLLQDQTGQMNNLTGKYITELSKLKHLQRYMTHLGLYYRRFELLPKRQQLSIKSTTTIGYVLDTRSDYNTVFFQVWDVWGTGYLKGYGLILLTSVSLLVLLTSVSMLLMFTGVFWVCWCWFGPFWCWNVFQKFRLTMGPIIEWDEVMSINYFSRV